MQCRGIGPHLTERGNSHGFSRVVAGPVVYSRVSAGMSIQIRVCSSTSGLLSSYEAHLGTSVMLGREIRMLLAGRQETQGTFLVSRVILGFLSILNKSQASSPFEALNSAYFSSCQRDVRPPVQMRWRPRAFSRVSTRDSDIPSSCEMRMNLHSSHCREIPPSFKSGNLDVHST